MSIKFTKARRHEEWVRIGPDDGDSCQLLFKLPIPYETMLTLAGMVEDGQIGPMVTMFLGDSVTDWRDVLDESGALVPFSLDNLKELLESSRTILMAVGEYIGKQMPDTFRQADSTEKKEPSPPAGN